MGGWGNGLVLGTSLVIFLKLFGESSKCWLINVGFINVRYVGEKGFL